VLLHPTSDAGALQQALDGARPDGEANLTATLKLALVGAGAGAADGAASRCLRTTLPPRRCSPMMLFLHLRRMQLVSRRFSGSSTHVTAFVASSARRPAW
jgi:hypothetical protein